MHFQIYHPQPKAACRLFCFPSAGGDAVMYRDWGERLGDSIEVLAFRYAGRGSRLAEPPRLTLSALCEDLQGVLIPLMDRPTYFFGHSLGAMVAFELATWLQGQGKSLTKLIVSGAVAPSESKRSREAFHQWEDEAFQKKLISLGGVPELLLQYPDLLTFLTPIIRADIQAIETYRYTSTPSLDCPLSVWSGKEDPVLKGENLQAWVEHGTAKVNFISLPGRHFYFQENPDPFFEKLKKEFNFNL